MRSAKVGWQIRRGATLTFFASSAQFSAELLGKGTQSPSPSPDPIPAEENHRDENMNAKCANDRLSQWKVQKTKLQQGCQLSLSQPRGLPQAGVPVVRQISAIEPSGVSQKAEWLSQQGSGCRWRISAQPGQPMTDGEKLRRLKMVEHRGK